MTVYLKVVNGSNQNNNTATRRIKGHVTNSVNQLNHSHQLNDHNSSIFSVNQHSDQNLIEIKFEESQVKAMMVDQRRPKTERN